MRPATWENVRTLLLPAIERARGLITEASVIDGLATGRLQAWRHGDSAAVSEFVVSDGKKVVSVTLFGGSLEDAREVVARIKKLGAAEGCEAIAFTGREGWKKVFPEMMVLAVLYYEEI